jgi:hypothetical protein
MLYYVSAHPHKIRGSPCKRIVVLSRNNNNSVSSFDVRSWDMITVLSGTLGSSETLLVSHSGSIDLLAELSWFSFSALLLLFSVFLILQIVYISVA